MAVGIKRIYNNFRGVDFMNEASLVDLRRSPDALNVWKNYQDNQGLCIETRTGFRLITQIGTKINGIYVLGDTAIVHSETKLYKWVGFPNTPTQETLTQIYTGMANARSVFNKFKDNLYINDGTNYLYYNGTTVAPVSNIAYVPTTTIGRRPAGGGEFLEDINVLTPKRKNSFVADGTSTTYVLDAVSIDSVDKVIVNDTEMTTGFTVDLSLGKVTFTTAPTAPAISGQDNVIIEFSKTVSGYSDRIAKCKKAVIWDNRMFFTGNNSYRNALFHSKLDDPTYIGDLSYYEDGSSNSAIKDIIVGSNVLWVLKDKDQNNANVFYHTRDIDAQEGAVYPTVQGNVATGCYVSAYNFGDDIVYLSKNGLEGIITSELDSRQIISHRSSLVDSRLINDTNYDNSFICEYKGYLLILTSNKVFLADSRQKFESESSFEYEWYYWDFSVASPNLLKEYNGNLYIGGTDGKIYVLDGTNDNNEAIYSYWTTPMDNFGETNKLKTTNKRGGVVKVKTIPNGRIKIARRTNLSEEYKLTTEKSLSGFNFNNIDFGNFSFTTTNQSNVVFKAKEKKIAEVSIKVYSDEKDKPFGVYSITLEAFVGSYIKR